MHVNEQLHFIGGGGGGGGWGHVSVRMWINTCAMEVWGHAPPERKHRKNGVIGCILSVPKYAIIDLKLNNFIRIINQKQPILFAICSLQSIEMCM